MSNLTSLMKHTFLSVFPLRQCLTRAIFSPINAFSRNRWIASLSRAHYLIARNCSISHLGDVCGRFLEFKNLGVPHVIATWAHGKGADNGIETRRNCSKVSIMNLGVNYRFSGKTIGGISRGIPMPCATCARWKAKPNWNVTPLVTR